MAAYHCESCGVNWPSTPEEYIKWEDDRNYRNVCANCLNPVEYYPAKQALPLKDAKEIAREAEWARREAELPEEPDRPVQWQSARKALNNTDELVKTLMEIRGLPETPHPQGLE